VLPKRFIDHAGISGEAVFVGRGQRFQIWAPEAFEAQNLRAFERAKVRGTTLPLRPNADGNGEG
jgi:MraZ protein